MKANSKKIFLYDALGAGCSAFFLGIILVHFNHYIGMPINVLNILAIVAVIFMINSFFSYRFQSKSNWKLLLKIIMIGNTFYWLLTIVLVMIYINQITLLGLLYFIVEAIIIAGISYFELKQIRFEY